MSGNLSKLAIEAEKELQAEVKVLLQSSSVEGISRKTRKNTAETLEGLQPDVVEKITELQVRMELLRNIAMNWEQFQADAVQRGLDLRLNQLKGLEELIAFLKNASGDHTGTHRGLMGYYVQPTGAGKTGLFSIEAKLADVPTLILVPFDNLLDQTKKDLIAIGGFDDSDIGIVGGGMKEVGRRITVATYASHTALMRRSKEYRSHVQQECKLVICDEVHTALGDRTHDSLLEIDGISNGVPTEEEMSDMQAEQDVLDHMESVASSKAVKIGFTATPKLSAKHVEEYFPQLIGRIYMADLINAGILVPYRIVQTDGYVYAGEIESYITQEQEINILGREGIYRKLLGEYADALVAFKEEKDVARMPLRGMAFCTNIQECDRFAEQASLLGIRTQTITGREAKGKVGREIIEDAKVRLVNGEIDLIITVEKLCAGFNFPEVNSIIWARITSMAKTIQGIGRGGRSFTDESGLKKEYCTVFETDWSLKEKNKKGRIPLRFADALAQNGEAPDDICRMGNGSLLTYRQPQSTETIRTAIIADFTPEQWTVMTTTEKRKLKINGLGLVAIATFFNVEGDPVGYHSIHLALGRAIFGDCEMLCEQSTEMLRSAITGQFQSKEWAGMKSSQKEMLKIKGYGLKAIATKFGIKGDPVGYHSDHLALGRAIFGDGESFIVQDASAETIRTEIVTQIEPETWAIMAKSEKAKFKIKGLGLKAIASLFKIKGNPISSNADHFALGRAIFGEHNALIEQNSDTLRAAIIAQFTPQQWAELRGGKRAKLKINGIGLKSLATIFEIQGDPIGYVSDYLALGRAIFGDCEVLQEQFTPQTYFVLLLSPNTLQMDGQR